MTSSPPGRDAMAQVRGRANEEDDEDEAVDDEEEEDGGGDSTGR